MTLIYGVGHVQSSHNNGDRSKMKIKNITGYGEGRKGEDVARHKRITCKKYSHAKNIE